jgi:FxsC-like protein
MPDYSFFLSYASSDRIQAERESDTTNRRDQVRVFSDELNAAMKGLGYPDGGFFDKKRLEAKWKPELQEGLASSRILVPLYSPNYFQSTYCGKEWETFNRRFDENERHRYADVTQSKVILPVFWKAPGRFPQQVQAYQIDYEDYPPEYKEFGLEYLMMFKRNTNAFKKFVWTFSHKLEALAGGQGAAKVRDILDFDTLDAPFPGQNRPGLKFVRYVFVAGMKHQMSTLRSTNDSYANFQDRRDWRPLYPDLDRSVEGIATGPAKADNRGFEFLPPSPQLMDRLREARRLNNVIVVMIDPWSVRLPELRQFLNEFDAEEFPNSAVLVNWNEKDPETSSQAAQLQMALQDHFKGRIGRKEYHKDPVSSPESIEQAVMEAFGAVQARLIELGKIRAAGNGVPDQAPVIRN